MKLAIASVLFVVSMAYAQDLSPTVELRCCVIPLRDAGGTIVRSAQVLAAFQRNHPCPSTGIGTGPCPGWSKDHVIPLACGGIDSVSNLQWLPNALKSAAGTLAKDRWERKVYCRPQVIVP